MSDPDTSSPRAATIYDVASRAGVSHQTVTRFLSGFPGIRPDTRARVESALRELDYRPNRMARALRSGKRKRIVVLAHALGERGPGRVVQGAIAECRRRGYTVEVVDFDGDDPGSLREAFDFLGSEPLSGLLATAQTDAAQKALAERVESDAGRLGFRTIIPAGIGAPFDGGRIAGLHLRQLGHRSVVHLSGPSDWPVARERLAGLRSVFDGVDGEVVEVMPGSWAPESGYRAGLAYRPEWGATAVFAANDQMALGFLHAMAERGIAVPDDVSVMGFDDFPEARFLLPPLTSVRDDFEQEGRYSAACLIADIEGTPRPDPPTNAVVLRARQSTAAPPRRR